MRAGVQDGGARSTVRKPSPHYDAGALSISRNENCPVSVNSSLYCFASVLSTDLSTLTIKVLLVYLSIHSLPHSYHVQKFREFYGLKLLPVSYGGTVVDYTLLDSFARGDSLLHYKKETIPLFDADRMLVVQCIVNDRPLSIPG